MFFITYIKLLNVDKYKLVQYIVLESSPPAVPTDPCYPSPCGPNSQCKNIKGQAVCSCLSEYIGSPPNCRPECVTSSECLQDKACIKNKCQDPCPDPCGVNANCKVINHSPICFCKTAYTGDPFTLCTFIQSKYFAYVRKDSNKLIILVPG